MITSFYQPSGERAELVGRPPPPLAPPLQGGGKMITSFIGPAESERGRLGDHHPLFAGSGRSWLGGHHHPWHIHPNSHIIKNL